MQPRLSEIELKDPKGIRMFIEFLKSVGLEEKIDVVMECVDGNYIYKVLFIDFLDIYYFEL